jgi:hypothetical protein
MLIRDREMAARALDIHTPEQPPITKAWRDALRRLDPGDVRAINPHVYPLHDRFATLNTLACVAYELWHTELHLITDIMIQHPYALSRRVSKILALDRLAVTWMAPIDMVRVSHSHFPLEDQRMLHADRWAKLVSELVETINATRCQIIHCRMWRNDMVAHGRSLICGVPIIVATATHILNLARSYWDDHASYSRWTKDGTTAVLEECINDLGLGISLIGEHISYASITVVAADNADGQDPPHQPIHVGTFNLDVNANP